MIAALIQARMGSTRFPGKSLADVAGKPLIGRVLQRLEPLQTIAKIAVVTSTDSSDDSLFEWCRSNQVSCYRGPLDDVLKRYAVAATTLGADTVVRLTGDCPLIDPDLILEGIRQFQEGDLDFLTNVLPPRFPDGLDFAIFSNELLQECDQKAVLKSEREHVVPWMWKNSNLQSGTKKAKNISIAEDYSALRWTVDYPQDLGRIELFYRKFPDGKASWSAIVDFYNSSENIEFLKTDIVRDEGYLKSLKSDAEGK